MRREDTLKRHDMRAETARMKVLALAVPVIAPERDGVRPVFTAERDLEAPEADPFGLFCVALADRYGRKPLIIRSFVAAFVALSLTALAPNVWVFALSRAIQSLGLGNTGLILATLAEQTPPGRIAFAFGIVNGANPLGG